MYEYRGLQDVVFLMLYGGVTLLALLACLYLLMRRGNAIVGEEIKSSRVLRRWTAALMVAMAASHVWWYAIGIYWLADDWQVRTILVIMLDHVTLVPLTMAVLLAMLQDCRRPFWPWFVAQSPVVVFAFVGILHHSMFWGREIAFYWQLAVITAFVTYYIYALWQYNRWLLDNYSDLDSKEVWQSLVFLLVLLAVYAVYTSNTGGLMREYLSQILSIAIIAFLLWRVETLQELETEEDDPEYKGVDP